MAQRRSLPAPLHGVPHVEASLRAAVDAGSLDDALNLFEHLLRRYRRTPHQTVCTRLLELCVARGSPRVALHVLEHMAEARGLEVDDYCRLVRLFILRRVSADELARFEETALDLLTFSDDGLHNYFAHVASLLNLELHEVVSRPGGCADAAAAAAALIASGGASTSTGGGGGVSSGSSSGAGSGLEAGLIGHRRMLDATVRLCRRAGALTPLVALLLHGMGGREGVQSDAELRELAGASSNLGTAEALEGARARLAELEASAALNASQRAAAEAGLTRRLTLVQGPPGTGKTQLASRLIALWVNELGVRPVLACADSNVAVDHLGLALVGLGLRVARAGRPEAVCDALHPYLVERLGVRREKIKLVPNGVDTHFFSPDPGQPKPGISHIVCVARLEPVKQLHLLLAGCGVLRDADVPFRCTIVGEGSCRDTLLTLREELGLTDHVAFVGPLESERVRHHLRSAHLAVLSSQSEGHPVSLLEAAAVGIPAVAPAVGGIPEIIVHGETGLLTDSADPRALGIAMARVCTDFLHDFSIKKPPS
jgi:hypothetical protein